MTPERILARALAGIEVYAIFVIDGQGTALSWNAGVEQVLGFGHEEFVGFDADRIFTPEDREKGAPERERQAAIERGTVSDFRWHLRRDGTRLWANGFLHAVHDDEGGLAGFVKILRDATRDKELNEALERSQVELEARVAERTREFVHVNEQLSTSERRFAEVFRVAPVAMVLTTVRDDILDVNRAFEAITGYVREEVIGRNAKDLSFWSSPDNQRKLREARAHEQGFHSLELQLRTKDGEILDIQASAAKVAIDHEGGLVKMFVDVTERKQNEKQLMRALQEVMQDTSWLAQRVVERLAQARGEQLEGPAVSDLTPRERTVLGSLARGATNEEIGEELGLAPSTVRNYITNIYAKIGVRSRAEAVVWARERGLGS